MGEVTQPNPKKHHYVPQFLLRNFSVGKKKRLYVFDKISSKVFTSHVRDAGHENDFYKDEHLGYGISTETKLSKLEDKCAPIIDKIVTEQSISGVTGDDHALICLFVAVQMARTNKTREFLSNLNSEIANWIRDGGGDPNKDVENFKEQSKSELKSSSINVLNTVPGDLVEHLVDKKIGLLKAPRGEGFYISDHPVTMYNNFPRPGRGDLGLRLKGIEVHLPISPRLSLTFMCSGMLSEIRDRIIDHNHRISIGTAFPVDMSEAESLINAIDNKETRELKPENLEFQNSLQVSQSSRFVFSNHKEFVLAKDMLKTNPELAWPVGLDTNL